MPGWWNPSLVDRVAVVGYVGGVGQTVGGYVGAKILGLVGFSSIGPVAGSSAALIQSSIGNAVAGSAFSWCQSLAMGSAATVSPTLVVAAVAPVAYYGVK